MSLCAVALTLLIGRSGLQDPNDPLIYGPRMAGGSRLQFGVNVVPAEWEYPAGLREKTTADYRLPGYRVITLINPHPPAGLPSAGAFVPWDCTFDGTTPVVTVFAQNGQKFKFIVDTGALHSYIKPSVAAVLNQGSIDPFPMALMLSPQRWIHFRVEVDPTVAVLSNPNAGFAEDGILGIDALSCLQLRIDYRAKKVWTRVAPKEPEVADIGLLDPGHNVKVDMLPMKKQASGRYTISLGLGDKMTDVEVDTGANLIGLNANTIADFGLDQVGSGTVIVESGQSHLNRYLAPSASIAGSHFLWPVIHGGSTQDPLIGGFGPSVLPHQAVVIDYPDLKLYAVEPTDDEVIEQALGQFIAGVVRFDGPDVVLDMTNILGSKRAVLLKVQDQPVAQIVADLRATLKGDAAAKARLVELYKQVSTKGQITFRQDGKEKMIDISG